MKRVLRCEFPTLGEPKCRKTAAWRVTGYYNGSDCSLRYIFVQQHMRTVEGNRKKVGEEFEYFPDEWKF